MDRNEYAVGRVITFSGFVSTTTDEDQAMTFLASKSTEKYGISTHNTKEEDLQAVPVGTIFEIRHAWGYPISEYSMFPWEKEVILEPDRQFSVAKFTQESPDLVRIELRMLRTPIVLPRTLKPRFPIPTRYKKLKALCPELKAESVSCDSAVIQIRGELNYNLIVLGKEDAEDTGGELFYELHMKRCLNDDDDSELGYERISRPGQEYIDQDFHDISDLESGATYRFRVRYVARGFIGGWSPVLEIKIKPADESYPVPVLEYDPESLQEDSVQLMWRLNTTFPKGTFFFYQLQMCDASEKNATFSTINLCEECESQVSEEYCRTGMQRVFRVRARTSLPDSAGPWSSPLSLKFERLNPPNMKVLYKSQEDVCFFPTLPTGERRSDYMYQIRAEQHFPSPDQPFVFDPFADPELDVVMDQSRLYQFSCRIVSKNATTIFPLSRWSKPYVEKDRLRMPLPCEGLLWSVTDTERMFVFNPLLENFNTHRITVDFSDEDSIIANALSCHDTSIVRLFLFDNPIGNNGALRLAKALEENKTVSRLILSNNGIFEKGMQALTNAFKKHPFTMLGISKNRLDRTCMDNLAEVIRTQTTLEELSLIKNDLFPEAVRGFMDALPSNRGLRSLELEKNLCCNSYVMSQFAQVLKVNSTLTNLSLSKTGITSREIVKWEGCLSSNYTLRELDLSRNEIDDRGLQTLVVMLAENETVRDVDISENMITPASIPLLRDLFEYNESIVVFEVFNENIEEKDADELLEIARSRRAK